MQTFKNSISCLLTAGLIVVFCCTAEAQDSSLQESLILRFRFEGSGDVAADASGNGNDGTIVGAQRTAGRFGKGLAIGARDEHVQISNILTPACTIEFWFKPNWDGSNPATFRLFDANTGAIYFMIGKGKTTGDRDTTFGFYLEDAADADFQDWETPATDAIPAANQWYHLATTWDFDAGEARFYINGEEVGSVTGLGNFPTLNTNPVIGFNSNAAYMAASSGADGVIDEFSIYSRALTVEELQVVMRGVGDFPWAYGPDPKDGALYSNTWATLSWSAGDFAVSHDVYMSDNFDDVNAGTADSFVGNLPDTMLIVGFPGFPFADGLVPGTTYYWRVDEVNDTEPNSPWKGEIWSFSIPPKTAYNPVPADGARFIAPDPTLTWTPGFGAKLHTVYFGDNFDDVSNASGGAPLGTTKFTPAGPLQPATTYYWRVDEFDPPATHKGNVWSFEVAKEGGGVKGDYYQGMNFQNLVLTRIDPQIDFNWGNAEPDPTVGADQFSVRWTGQVEAVFDETYTFYTNSDDGIRLWIDGKRLVNNWTDHGNTENSGKIDLVGGQSYSVVMEHYENGGGAVAQLRWSSPSTPKDLIPAAALSELTMANTPMPRNGSVGAKLVTALTWKPGDSATSHEVYFGTDADAVANATKASPEYKGGKQLGSESLDPGKLAINTDYYWRVDEVSAGGTVKGNVWSFNTGDFLLVDDFETYNDIEPPDAASNRIFDKWIDGFGTTTNGALAGNDLPPYAALNDIHGGEQAMPYRYDNNLKTSEATLTLVWPRDWTEGGVTKLSLWFKGDAGNSAERMFVALNGSSVAYHADPAATQTGRWTEWVIDLSAFTGVNLANVNTLTIGFGTKGSPAAGGTGTMLFDDIRLVK